MPTKYQTAYPGVRYYQHDSRLYNRRPDQYFSIRYRTSDGQRREDGLGWASKGWNAKKAYSILSTLQENITSGKGPQTLREVRLQLAEEKIREEEEHQQSLPLTFNDASDMYLKAKTHKKSYRDDAQRLNDHVLKVIGDVNLCDLHHGHIDGLRLALEEKNLAPATIKQCLVLIRAVYNHVRKIPLDPSNPAQKVFAGANPFDGYERMPRCNNRREAWFTPNQMDTIVAEVERVGGDFADFVTLAMFTGMRRGEIASLNESDIIVETNSIVVRSEEEKNGEGRVVFVPSEVMRRLSARLTGNPDKRLFSIHEDTVTHKFSSIIRTLGLHSKNRRASACFHTLRHTLITHMVMDGAPLSMVQDVSGHKSFEMVRRYAKTSAPQARQAVSAYHRKMVSAGRTEEQKHCRDDESQATD